jgi:hypothetical protein
MTSIMKSQPTNAMNGIKDPNGKVVVDMDLLNAYATGWELEIHDPLIFIRMVKNLKRAIRDMSDGDYQSQMVEMGGIRIDIHGTCDEFQENLERLENEIHDVKVDLSKARALKRLLLWYACVIGSDGDGYAKKENGRNW